MIDEKGEKMSKKAIKTVVLGMALILIIGAFAACKSNEEKVETDMTKISEFAVKDIDGNEINQDFFKNADVTMINYWGTYCMPCISEMPDIAQISKDYAGRAQVLGVVVDVDFSKPDSEEYKDMLKILSSADADFTNIGLNGDIYNFATAIPGIPTTIFVDKEGNLIADPVVGAQVEEYKKTLDECLSKSE